MKNRNEAPFDLNIRSHSTENPGWLQWAARPYSFVWGRVTHEISN